LNPSAIPRVWFGRAALTKRAPASGIKISAVIM
jgi:hypothetical protein